MVPKFFRITIQNIFPGSNLHVLLLSKIFPIVYHISYGGAPVSTWMQSPDCMRRMMVGLLNNPLNIQMLTLALIATTSLTRTPQLRNLNLIV